VRPPGGGTDRAGLPWGYGTRAPYRGGHASFGRDFHGNLSRRVSRGLAGACRVLRVLPRLAGSAVSTSARHRVQPVVPAVSVAQATASPASFTATIGV
jgi:hypothetical protein